MSNNVETSFDLSEQELTMEPTCPVIFPTHLQLLRGISVAVTVAANFYPKPTTLARCHWCRSEHLMEAEQGETDLLNCLLAVVRFKNQMVFL